MTQITECGISNTHLLTIPTMGDFRLGFEDYELSDEETGQTIKLSSGQVKDEIKPLKALTVTVTLWDITKAEYEAIEVFALNDMANYLSTMKGTVTINLGGRTVNNCIIKGIARSESYFDYEQVERFDNIKLKIENPESTYF